ncbi:MAG TPA: hypothetical protein VL327_12220 [Pyrinomonadaceae bacterium]|jgi:hypothetical protein|nr:hypothetical protein [Pyrinomonadaceae bacterium]
MSDRGDFYAPDDVKRWRTLALGIGGIGLIIWAVGLYFNSEQALRSWILGYVFWSGIGIGCLGVLIMSYLTGGAWAVVSRRTLEAGARTLPIIVLLFIPLALGVAGGKVFTWTHLPPTEHTMVQRGWFMTPESWILRSIFYFAVFGTLTYLLTKWSGLQDQTSNPEDSAAYLGKSTKLSGPSMIIWCVIVSFCAVDWVMELDPHFTSTIYGMLYIAGWGLSCYCFVVTILALLSDKPGLNRVLGKRHFHDLGKLMLALVMIWAYFNFAQYLIIWSGNIPEETHWFVDRTKGGWGYIGALLIFFHFAFPFLVLLQQDFKRKAKWIASLAIFILLMRLFDYLYLVGPNPWINEHIERGAFIVSWMDVIAPIAVGGIWLWWFFGELMKRPLVPVQDPFLENAIEHGHGH